MAAQPSPQLHAAAETSSKPINIDGEQPPSLNGYISLFKSATKTTSRALKLKEVTFLHGEPTITFDSSDIAAYIQDENLQFALLAKFSYGKPDMSELRKLFPQQMGIKGDCNLGFLDSRHILVRLVLHEDFISLYSRVGKNTLVLNNGKGTEFPFRIQRWTPKFNPKEETSIALAWISFPNLPVQFFAREALFSLASAIGTPLVVDKATNSQSRPSVARVKVEVDLLSSLPERIRLFIKEDGIDELQEIWQKVVYDRLPSYCTTCNHQGHKDEVCRWNLAQQTSVENKNDGEKFQGDLRDKLNEKRRNQIAELTAAKELVLTNSIAATPHIFGHQVARASGESASLAIGVKSAEVVDAAARELDAEISGQQLIKNGARAADATLSVLGQQSVICDVGENADLRQVELAIQSAEAAGQHVIVENKRATTGSSEKKDVDNVGVDVNAQTGQKCNDKQDNVAAYESLENSSSNEITTGNFEKQVDIANGKGKSVDNKKNWIMVTHKKPSGIRIGSPVHSQLCQSVETPADQTEKEIISSNPFDVISDKSYQGEVDKTKELQPKEIQVAIFEDTKIVQNISLTSAAVVQPNGVILDLLNKGCGIYHPFHVVAGMVDSNNSIVHRVNSQLVGLNKSDQEVPSQTFDASPSMSVNNKSDGNNEIVQLHQLVEVECLNNVVNKQKQLPEKGQQCDSSIWADLVEQADDNIGVLNSPPTDDTNDKSEKILAIARKGLSPNAPVFVPSKSPPGKQVLVETNQLATGQQQISLSRTRNNIAIGSPSFQKKNSTDRELLDALVNSISLAPINTSKYLQVGGTSTFSPKSFRGAENFEEGEEDDILDECYKNAAREAGISPRHQRSGKSKNKNKTHGRNFSWGDKESEEFIPRQLPMRQAKQKVAVPTTSTKSNKSKKK